MNSLSNNPNKLVFASTFLSHSSKDKPLVKEVAKQLCRRGIIPWLDENELYVGLSLTTVLKEAILNQLTMTIFLSENSLNSDWCQKELLWAIENAKNDEHLLPVYLDNPLTLVKKHPLLKSKFLHADGDKVDKLGVFAGQNTSAQDIADKIAIAVYRHSISNSWSEVAIFLDQRGNGERSGLPDIQPNIQRLEIPMLTFRPDTGERKQQDILTYDDWNHMSSTNRR